jgi:hypothetical protein
MQKEQILYNFTFWMRNCPEDDLGLIGCIAIVDLNPYPNILKSFFRSLAWINTSQ